MNIFTIISLVILLVSLVIHEMAHGYAATLFGDDTPRLQGRLSINPVRHLDPMGSVVLPILLLLSGSPLVFGWAKPVVFNPNNFTTPFARRWGRIVTAVAGPASNIAVALLFGLGLRFILPHIAVTESLQIVVIIWSMIVTINLSLAVFNLIPLPPLDGHHIWDSMLPARYSVSRFMQSYGMWSFIPLIIVATLCWRFIQPVIPVLFKLITGVAF